MIFVKLLLGIPLIVLGIKDLKKGIHYLNDAEQNTMKTNRTLWTGLMQILLGILLILINWNNLR